MRFFVDTSAWISLAAFKDQHHAEVAAVWHELLNRGARPVTTNDVAAETITFLRYRASHQAAVSFHDMIERSVAQGRLIMIRTDEDLSAKAWEVFLKYADQDLSMTDCLSIALCRRERIGCALTLDGHFRMAGIRMLPGRD